VIIKFLIAKKKETSKNTKDHLLINNHTFRTSDICFI
jgi:hypothetical protein